MSAFGSCSVSLTGKGVYRNGDVLSGTVELDVNAHVFVNGIRVYLFGESLVKWDEYDPGRQGDTRLYIAKEKYFGQVITLIGNKQNVAGPNVTLTPGRHKYNFKFTFRTQTGSPSSYEGEYGSIRYWIKVEVDRSFPYSNRSWNRGFTVHDYIDVNELHYKAPVRRQKTKQVSKVLGFGNAGTLTLTSSTDRGAYCAGEKIALSVVVTNRSTKSFGTLTAQLVQNVVFTANNETKTRETIIRVLEDAPVMKGEERVWKNELLEIDAIPPSTKPGSCHIIFVSYYVQVIVEVPMGFNLETTMPITIGTVPYGYTPPATGTTAARQGGGSAAISYRKCTRGFESCQKSDGNFPNYSYVPVCVYVPNYVFPPRQRPTPSVAPQAQRPKPSAPPIDKPPSYEDAVKTSKSPVVVEQKKADKPYGILALRFPDAHIHEFRATIMKESKSLATCEGEVIACASQIIAEPELWPERTSVAMLKFASVEAATDWLNKTPGVADASWLGSCDAVVGKMYEQYVEARRIFTMEMVRVKEGWTKAKVAKYLNLVGKTIRPLRLTKTGVNLVTCKKDMTLRGQWLEKGWSFVVCQWESLKKFYEFEHEKQAKYKEVNDMTRELSEIKPAVVFQSEDLSPFKVSQIQSAELSKTPAREVQAHSGARCKETRATNRTTDDEKPRQTEKASDTTPGEPVKQSAEAEEVPDITTGEPVKQYAETEEVPDTTSEPAEHSVETEECSDATVSEPAEQSIETGECFNATVSEPAEQSIETGECSDATVSEPAEQSIETGECSDATVSEPAEQSVETWERSDATVSEPAKQFVERKVTADTYSESVEQTAGN